MISLHLLFQFLGTYASPLYSDILQHETFDLQAHRGGRGETVESTLASFAWYGLT